MHKNNTAWRRSHHHIAFHITSASVLGLIIFINVYVTLVRPAAAQNVYGDQWRGGNIGHETVHEKLGQVHFPPPIYDEYESKIKYTQEPNITRMGMGPVFSFTRFLFSSGENGSYLYPDYIKAKHENNVEFGPKVESNDWTDLLAHNLLFLIFWVVPLLILIVIVPFIGVCYCCFCCCRCRPVCPPCYKEEKSRRLCYSILLLFLILGLLLGLLIAFLSNKQINRGFRNTKNRARRVSEDTCEFLRDVSDHVKHLFVHNFNQLRTHLIEQSTEAYNHIFLDVTDASGANALAELERILNNMQRASGLMRQVDQSEKTLRFNIAQFRDSLRGLKRNILYALVVECYAEICVPYVKSQGINLMDTSKCLHVDLIPNSTMYVEDMEKSLKLKLGEIPTKGLKRLQEISATIKKAMGPILPPLIKKLNIAGENLRVEMMKIQDIIDALISDIHLRSLNATTFTDTLNRFGAERHAINIFICLSLFLIIILSIMGLVYGLCIRKSNIGSHFMLLVIILIFCVLSIITLVGLFYFILGLMTYQGVCLGEYDKLTNKISSCPENDNIFHFLAEKNLYDINSIKRFKINDNEDETVKWYKSQIDLSKISLLEKSEMTLINQTFLNLSNYRSSLYTDHMCKKLYPHPNLAKLCQLVYNWTVENVYEKYVYTVRLWRVVSTLFFTLRDCREFAPFEDIIKKLIDVLTEKLHNIDTLILGKNLNFGETIEKLMTSIKRSEKFIKERGQDFINTIGENLTMTISEQLDEYTEMVIAEGTSKVGNCKQMAIDYRGGLEYACDQLIDPINGFWVGSLLSALLLLPLLFVAHRLMCLYKVHTPYVPQVLYLVRNEGCPTCTGAPYKPPPVVICDGGQQAFCSCPEFENKTDSEPKKSKRE